MRRLGGSIAPWGIAVCQVYDTDSAPLLPAVYCRPRLVGAAVLLHLRYGTRQCQRRALGCDGKSCPAQTKGWSHGTSTAAGANREVGRRDRARPGRAVLRALTSGDRQGNVGTEVRVAGARRRAPEAQDRRPRTAPRGVG